MTQYVEEPREAFVESEDEQEQRDNLELAAPVTMLREDDLDEAKGDQTKGELSREDVHDISARQDLHEDGPGSCRRDSHCSGARSATHTPAGNACKAMRLEA